MTQIRAEVGNLQDLLSRIGAGLDQFLKFEYPDAQANAESWRVSLDQPLPQIGIDAVTRELLEQVIPNGSLLSRPGCTSYITTGGTTASTLASTAVSVASPQRYLSTAFNFLEELSPDCSALLEC